MNEKNNLRHSGMTEKWMRALREMPELARLGAPCLCCTACYPVALLEMQLQEYSFEAFEVVEETILRFCALGMHTPAQVAEWMNIPFERYVGERMALLRVEGLLDENNRPTELGTESLKIGQKKTLIPGMQIFQADAIAGILLPREYQSTEKFLHSREETMTDCLHIAHSDALAVESIRRSIAGPDNIRKYKRYRNDILHVNVAQVDSIRLDSLKYMEVLLVWQKNSEYPLILLPCHAYDTEARHMIKSDKPLYLPQRQAAALPQLAKTVTLVPEAELLPLRDTCVAMLQTKNAQPEEIRRWMQENTAFTVETVQTEETAHGQRVVAALAYTEDARFTALDLELLAAMGAGTPMPVELRMEMATQAGGAFRKRVTVFPQPVGKVADLARKCSEGWLENNRSWCYRAPARSWQDVEALMEKQEEED